MCIRDRVYGEDYCNLGHLAGGETAMGVFIRDPQKACPTDFYGNSSAGLPILDGIESGKDIQLLIYFSDSVTAEWIRQAGPLGVPVSYTHLDVYKRQVMAQVQKLNSSRRLFRL